MSGNEIRSQTLPFTCLFLKDPSLGAIEQVLIDKTTAYKSYFYNSPLIINIEGVDDIPDVAEIKKITDKYNFILVGFSGVSKNDIKIRIFNAGLPVFNALGARDIPQAQLPQPDPEALKAAKKQEPEQPQHAAGNAQCSGETKFVMGNVRSGCEVRADHASLLIRGDVSNGAKVFADNDIIILGALRGRAVAGAHGNVNAHIVCLQYDPELISIGGVFKTGDAIDEELHNKHLHIRLEDEKFKFEVFEVKENKKE